MHFWPIIEGLLIVLVANGAPVLGQTFLGSWCAWPVDFGLRFFDGAPLLGQSKTIRGVVLSVAATSLAALLLAMPWTLGALAALGAMAGDLLSSFVKRRLKLPSQSMAPGLDQAPESVFPLLVCKQALGLSALDVLVGAALFWVGEMALSRALFDLKIRERPY
jgi:hypothetical protein